MIEQLKTIRAGLEAATCYSLLGADAHSVQIALTALTQLEAMVGEQKPVAWQRRMRPTWGNSKAPWGPWGPWGPWEECSEGQAKDCWRTPLLRDWAYEARALYTAAPVAQQYEAGDVASASAQGFRDGVASVAQQPPKLEDIEQYRMQMAGISTAAIGYWKEGDSIHPDYDTLALRDVAKLYAKYDALYKAQQPQADTPQATTIAEAARDVGKWLNERPNRPIDLRHVAMLVAHAMQPQAEAVPPGFVLVPVEPDETWAYRVIRHHQPDLEVGGKAWLECLKEMLHWHAAIAQQKGAKT